MLMVIKIEILSEIIQDCDLELLDLAKLCCRLNMLEIATGLQSFCKIVRLLDSKPSVQLQSFFF